MPYGWAAMDQGVGMADARNHASGRSPRGFLLPRARRKISKTSRAVPATAHADGVSTITMRIGRVPLCWPAKMRCLRGAKRDLRTSREIAVSAHPMEQGKTT